MNDEQLIQHLERLKQFETKDETISVLKGRVFSSIENKNPAQTQKTHINFARTPLFVFRPVFLYPAAGLLFLLLLVTQGYRLLDMSHVAYLETRAALATNGYEKARWSLDLAQFELKKLESGSNDSVQIAYLSDVSSKTDLYMSNLHLVGEPGQYSAEQCLDAYKAYEDYLGELQATVQGALMTNTNAPVRSRLSALEDQAQHYQQAADARLKLY